ncbi:ferrochelatase [Schizosaccharomyces octosporus yFS286]|uniref:Ferrochelatase n=1 Tax=Schizosaccharomyces octosporus (strain yFS286) TaxID=483514 RepID=S9PUU3_SCHOY|nr:ferrochelatase [Schizosaccharomyces octosporus yFS286]EPX71762.1 ferrochelatase [Schizosaccharomyces octosporus yFS286]
MIRSRFVRFPVIKPACFSPAFGFCFQNPSLFIRKASSMTAKTTESVVSKDTASKEGGPTAIVMLNMGGPSNLDEVGPFLERLFADGDIIPLGYFQNFLGKFIAKRRTPVVRDHYKDIGGGSPILHWTEYQGKEICKILDKTSPHSAPHVPFVAFRYAPPLTEEMLKDLKDSKIKRAVAFSQYPQWSCSTSGASLNELRKQLLEMNMEHDIDWSVLDRWPLQEGLLTAFSENIQKTLETYPEEERENVIIIFSAHSLPMSQVSKGDPYVNEVAATTYGIMEKLGFKNKFINSWQSKVGPIPWMSPSTEDVIDQFGKQGHKNMILVPVAFTSDHIETLKELEDYIEDAKKKGITGVKRAPSINDNAVAIKGMADEVKLHLETNTSHSRQFTQRCPGCTNESCEKRIEFFRRC